MLINDLKNLEQKYLELPERDDTEYPNIEQYFCGSLSARDSIKGSVLEDFEKELDVLMKNAGYDYQLNLSIVDACDGCAWEFVYVLSWYDGDIKTCEFCFMTEY